MKFIAPIALFIGAISAAQWELTCKNETFDTASFLLTADCDDGDGKGTIKTSSIHVNTCFSYVPSAGDIGVCGFLYPFNFIYMTKSN
jgi:hypothetical protein